MMNGNQEDDGDGVEKLTFGRLVHKQRWNQWSLMALTKSTDEAMKRISDEQEGLDED